MPVALLDAAGWGQVRHDAIACQSLRAAADAHGVPYDAVKQRASREKWPVGHQADQRREDRKAIVIAKAKERGSTATAVVSPIVTVTDRQPGDILDQQVQEHGRQTRAMLAQALLHASGQARRTKHPLDRARQIKDVAAAAAQVHGWSGDAAASIIMPIQINITRE